jgi:hypothetical protein
MRVSQPSGVRGLRGVVVSAPPAVLAAYSRAPCLPRPALLGPGYQGRRLQPDRRHRFGLGGAEPQRVRRRRRRRVRRDAAGGPGRARRRPQAALPPGPRRRAPVGRPAGRRARHRRAGRRRKRRRRHGLGRLPGERGERRGRVPRRLHSGPRPARVARVLQPRGLRPVRPRNLLGQPARRRAAPDALVLQLPRGCRRVPRRGRGALRSGHVGGGGGYVPAGGLPRRARARGRHRCHRLLARRAAVRAVPPVAVQPRRQPLPPGLPRLPCRRRLQWQRPRGPRAGLRVDGGRGVGAAALRARPASTRRPRASRTTWRR